MDMMPHIPETSNFLEGLPSSIPRYTYNGRDQFDTIISLEREHLERSCQTGASKAQDVAQNLHTMHLRSNPHTNASQYILFKISSHDLQTDFLDKVHATGLSLRLSYSLTSNLLLVKIMDAVYLEIVCRFHEMILLVLACMNLRPEYRSYPGVNVQGDETGKDADWAWGPVDHPEYLGRPTVVLAVCSEANMLERDLCWWLGATGGRAKLVIAVLVDRSEPRITLDVWRVGKQRRVQRLSIEKGRRQQLVVTGDPLVIPFESLFLRRAREAVEGDVVLSKRELEVFAECVWRVQSVHHGK